MADANKPDMSGKLTFDNEKGAGRSKWVAAFFALALIGWMGSGYILPSEPTEDNAEDQAPIRAVTVAVMSSVSQDVDLVLTAEGQAEPDRKTMIRSEATGDVAEVAVGRGDLVAAGQVIARVSSDAAEAQLRQARAQLDQAQRDADNATALQNRGIATEDRVAQSRAALAAAQAQVTTAQDAVDNTVIRAPFAGRLNSLTLDEGEFVTTGAEVAEILDNDPLSIVIQVPQQALSRLAEGQAAEVSFITGEVRDGTVGFIGGNADAQTRTFRVEVTVDNPDSVLPAGLSAQVRIPTGTTQAHFISPAILSLSPSGELGVKTVVDDNKVAFVPIEIARAQTDGVWVTGLSDTADIITVGQGFVNNGETVDPRPEAAADDVPDAETDADIAAQAAPVNIDTGEVLQ